MTSDSYTVSGQAVRKGAIADGGLLWRNVRSLIAYFFIIAGTIFTAMPFVWMVLSSFKGAADIAAVPLRWFPTVWHPENYVTVWELMPFSRFYLILLCIK